MAFTASFSPKDAAIATWEHQPQFVGQTLHIGSSRYASQSILIWVLALGNQEPRRPSRFLNNDLRGNPNIAQHIKGMGISRISCVLFRHLSLPRQQMHQSASI
jgi:hypothetical protein